MATLTRWTSPLIVLILAASLTGCTTRSPKSRPTPVPSVTLHISPSQSPSTPTDPKAAAVQSALAAYRSMWQTYVTATRGPDPTDPNLARYATGAALRTLTNGLQSLKDEGLKGTGDVTLAPQVSTISPADTPTKISIRDCVNTAASQIVRASPGLPYSDTPGGRRLCLADVERQGDGSWKVTSFGLREVGTCG